MFKLNDKKHRKRALMKLNGCKPNCGANDERDEIYEVSNGHKVTTKTIERAIQYNLDEAPSHLVRKTMKFEEIYSQDSSSGLDEVDRAGSSQMTRQMTLDFPTIERNIQSKVKINAASLNWIKDLHGFQVYGQPTISRQHSSAVVVAHNCSNEIDFNTKNKYLCEHPTCVLRLFSRPYWEVKLHATTKNEQKVTWNSFSTVCRFIHEV